MLNIDRSIHAPRGAYWVTLTYDMAQPTALPTVSVMYRFDKGNKRSQYDERFATISIHNRGRLDCELYLHDRKQKIICSTKGEAIVLANSLFSLT